MEKVVTPSVEYFEVDLGVISFQSFDSQELVVRMAAMNLSLN
jgi:hypothetical protein